MDSLPIGYSDSARILLIKRKDSAFVCGDKRILFISELAIRRAEQLLPVSRETWISSRRGTVTLGLGFLDARGKPDSLDARVEAGDIERVFLRLPVAPGTAAKGPVLKDRSGAFIFGMLGMLLGTVAGGIYGKYWAGGSDGSMPGMKAWTYSMAGMGIGLFCGVQFGLDLGE
jgi:hypothetical protein